jgi:hypothetical protein
VKLDLRSRRADDRPGTQLEEAIRAWRKRVAYRVKFFNERAKVHGSIELVLWWKVQQQFWLLVHEAHLDASRQIPQVVDEDSDEDI